MRALNEVLRAACRAPSVLDEAAFGEFVLILRRYVGCEGVALVVLLGDVQRVLIGTVEGDQPGSSRARVETRFLEGTRRLELGGATRTSFPDLLCGTFRGLPVPQELCFRLVFPLRGAEEDAENPREVLGYLIPFFRSGEAARRAPLAFLDEVAGIQRDCVIQALARNPEPRPAGFPDAAAEREAAAHLARIRVLENELRTLLDNAPLIIFRLDPATGKLLYLNRHAERLLRVPIDEALRTPGFLRAVHVDAGAARAFDEAFQYAQRGRRSPPYEARLKWGDEEEIAVRGTVYPLLSEDGGAVVAIEGILADVSAEHAARSRLVQTDRLSTLGMLAAGVAHEINNPATFLMLGLSQLQRSITVPAPDGTPLPGSPETADLVRELRECLNRIVNIARDLRLFAASAGPQPSRPALIDVNQTVQSALTLTRSRIMERARIVVNEGRVEPVLMEDGRLCQVLVNLFVNAAQAVARGPGSHHTVHVETRTDGEFVEIAVSDTGIGVPPEQLGRIFLPFFTTKGAGEGTGLGLSISREIVERAGGRIDVLSPVAEADGVPHGSRFFVRLPIAAPIARPPAAPVEAPVTAVSRLRVLLVDDEVALGRVVATELGRSHDVTCVTSGEEAYELLKSRRFDVVLCDMRMPGMSGQTLFECVRERDETQARAFVFMTGIGFGSEIEGFLASTGQPCLQKPFTMDQVLDALDQAASSRCAPDGRHPVLP